MQEEVNSAKLILKVKSKDCNDIKGQRWVDLLWPWLFNLINIYILKNPFASTK